MKIKKVYLGQRQIYPDWWSPGENTIFYIKWEWDITDYWPNNLTFTNNLVTITDKYLNFPWTSQNRLTTSWANIPNTYTLNIWMYIAWLGTSYAPRIIDSSSWEAAITYWWSTSGNQYKLSYNKSSGFNGSVLPTQTRFNFVATRNPTWKTKIYINSVVTDQTNSASMSMWTWIILWCKFSSSWDSFQWRMARIILENKERTAEEVSTYYNKTKGNYGL